MHIFILKILSITISHQVIQYRCNITQDDEDNIVIQKFKQCYNKSTINEEQLLLNFNYIKSHDNTNITIYSDKSFDQLNQNQFKVLKGFNQYNKKNQTIDCQKYICYAKTSLTPLKQIYSSVDLREASLIGFKAKDLDQGQFGSCWAFSTAIVLDNSIRYDQYSQQNQVPKPFQDSTVSIQFVMSNTYGFSDYDEGGDFVAALHYILNNFNTLEITTNYKYNPSKYKKQHQDKQLLQPIINQDEYYLPYQQFQNQLNPLQSSNVIQLNQNSVFSKNSIRSIKSFLSMGLAVSGAMSVNINSQKFMFYNGKNVLYEPCDSEYQHDHQITFIGYGKFKDQDVWLIQNSHGQEFGNNGTFFVPIGSNSYCIEQYAYGIIPRTMNIDQIKPWNLIGDHTVRGSRQLDKDHGQLEDNNGDYTPFDASQYIDDEDSLTIFQIVLISISSAFLLSVIMVFLIRGIKYCKQRKEEKINKQQNVYEFI